MSSSSRLATLDGLRGLLAVYVLASHLLPFAALPAPLAPLAGVFSHGGAAVDVFFALSGLVIARSLARFDYRALPFLAARIRRLYPAYLPVLALAVAIQPLATGFAHMPWIAPGSAAHSIWSGGWAHAAWIDVALHLVLAHGLVPAALGPDRWVALLGAAWSLSAEAQFYLLALLLSRRRRAAPAAHALLALAVAALAWRHAAPPGWQFSRAFLPERAQYFALGLAGAALLAADGAWRRYAAVLGAALAVCWVHQGVAGLAAPLVWTLALALEAAPGIAILAPLRRLLRSAAAQWLGAISYPLYLVNEPVQKLLGLALARLAAGNGALFTLLWLPLGIALPVALAWALHRGVEAPIQAAPRRRRAARWADPAGG